MKLIAIATVFMVRGDDKYCLTCSWDGSTRDVEDISYRSVQNGINHGLNEAAKDIFRQFAQIQENRK